MQVYGGWYYVTELRQMQCYDILCFINFIISIFELFKNAFATVPALIFETTSNSVCILNYVKAGCVSLTLG